VIVVRAEDAAGNSAELSFPVTYVSAGGGGVSLGVWAAIGVVLAILAGLGIAFLFGRLSGPAAATPPGTAPPEAKEAGPEPAKLEATEGPAPPPALS
jgi:hypothetical protein